ncbi:hypothetical protein IGI04_017313 [Brassica rapa subsp. trilocularis]|uniref:Neprosin activation peptide domain-containing protein n=1 Tax=Brassica rapa subsp. trilocularis TaxID=1813537 RepID=A0ABQ7M9N4_BRACM|nr:hypothetical protein IGI04_017313 [Brassica rapa subsp. trilocularis]
MSPYSDDLTSKSGNVLVKETLCLPPTLTLLQGRRVKQKTSTHKDPTPYDFYSPQQNAYESSSRDCEG